MTRPEWMKRPRPVHLTPKDYADYMALDAAVSHDEPAVAERPSEQIVTMLRRAAWKALDGNLDPEESYLLVAEVLLSLGYQTPADGLVRWRTLLDYLADFQRWSEAGANWDETGRTEDTWLTMIRDELVAVAGRPL